MRKIIYAATPFRMENLTEKICDFIQDKGHFPLHPFNTLPCQDIIMTILLKKKS